MQSPPDGKDRPSERGHLFDATRWSLIVRGRDGSQAALNDLFTAYRRPLLVLVRAQRFRLDDARDAEDFVQGFFAHMLQKDFLAKVQREKGRFRTILRESFENFLRDERDKWLTMKRGGGEQPASLNEANSAGELLHNPPAPTEAADGAFDTEWARTLLRNSWLRLESECARTGHGALCQAIEPILYNDEDAPAYRTIADQLGMTEGAVRVAALRIRKRLQGIIREEVMETVASEEELEEELEYLKSLFGQ